MPPKVSAREVHAAQLAKEIIAVYKSVRALEPNILENIETGRKELNKNGTLWSEALDWFPVKKDDPRKKKKNTVRHLMLKKYRMDPGQRDAVATCRLSFDITSNSTSFHIDHFEPKDAFIKRIDALALDEQLLELVRTKLKLDLDAHVVDALIFKEVPKENKKTGTKFNLIGLKQIYYNCPLNLWPVSGTSNTSKNALDSLTSVVPSVLESVKRHLPSEVTKDFVDESAKELAVSIDKAFQEHCKKQNINLNYSIIPMFFDPESQKPVTLLRFFEHTPLGEIADRYAGTMNHLGTRALHVARHAARASFRQGEEGQRDSKKLTTLLKLANREARAQASPGSEEDGGVHESSSDIPTDDLDAIEELVKSAKRKKALEKNKGMEETARTVLSESSEPEMLRKKQKRSHMIDSMTEEAEALMSRCSSGAMHLSTPLSLFAHTDAVGSLGDKIEQNVETKAEYSDTDSIADDERSDEESAYSDFTDPDEEVPKGP